MCLLVAKLNYVRENEYPSEVEENSRKRVRYILGILGRDDVPDICLAEIEKYGIAQSAPRTLAQYQEISGVDFLKGTITDKAKYGGLTKDVFMEDMMDAILALVANLNSK